MTKNKSDVKIADDVIINKIIFQYLDELLDKQDNPKSRKRIGFILPNTKLSSSIAIPKR